MFSPSVHEAKPEVGENLQAGIFRVSPWNRWDVFLSKRLFRIQGFVASAVPCIVAFILIAAAGFKAKQIFAALRSPNASSPSEWLFSLALVPAEIALGVLLISGWHANIARRIGFLVFSVFLSYSFLGLFSGAKSCGCLGTIEIRPLFAVAADSLILVALWSWRPPFGKISLSGYYWRCIFGFLCLVAVAANQDFFAENIEELEVHPAIFDLGTVSQSGRASFSIRFRNKRATPIVVDRIEVSCPCLECRQPRFTLPGMQSMEAHFDMDLSKEPLFFGDLLVQIKGLDPAGRKLFSSQARLTVEPKIGLSDGNMEQ
jgi:hypothetical protein